MNENLPLLTPAINDWVTQATQELAAADIPTPRLDAELILAHTIRKTRTHLHAHPDEMITERQADIANARLALRLDRVPVAYIIGHKEFYGRRFHVTNATLIPRPESEDIIDLLATIVPKSHSLLSDAPLRLVDVGTGSGALGITAKLEHPELEVTLLDISRHALNVAEKNAASLEADVTIRQSDLLAKEPLPIDILIANLPYVDPEWERSPETNHEPAEALFASNGGLHLIFELLVQAKTAVTKTGWMILEADPEQHAAIVAEAKKQGFLLKEARGYCLLFERLI